MGFRVATIYEKEIDKALATIDREGSELLRILDLPPGPLAAADCADCRNVKPGQAGRHGWNLCMHHEGEAYRIQEMNRFTPNFVIEHPETLTVCLKRYALVYRTVSGSREKP
jgi:hypothetical protein